MIKLKLKSDLCHVFRDQQLLLLKNKKLAINECISSEITGCRMRTLR